MMNNETPAVVNADANMIAEVKAEAPMTLSVSDLSNPGETSMYCSIPMDGSVKSKMAVFNAVNSPEKKVADCIGEVIMLKDIVAHEIWLTDENTGETIKAMRIVLIDDNGVGYEAVSSGLSNAIQRILDIFGQPNTWKAPIPVKPIQKSTRNGVNKVTTLKIEA